MCTLFYAYLRSLKENELIYQTPNGIITLDKKGEKLVEHYEFYAAFQAPSEWKIICEGKEIGQISSLNLLFIQQGVHILLAGKRWEVVEVKNKSEVIIVKKAYGKKPIKFGGGGQNIHRRIEQKMFEFYECKFIPKYVSKNTIPILNEAYEQYEIYAKPKDGNICIALEGSKIKNTLALILSYLEIEHELAGIGFYSSQGNNHIKNKLKNLDFELINWNGLLKKVENKTLKKFDHLLPAVILDKSYIDLTLDIKGAKEFCKHL